MVSVAQTQAEPLERTHFGPNESSLPMSIARQSRVNAEKEHPDKNPTQSALEQHSEPVVGNGAPTIANS